MKSLVPDAPLPLTLDSRLVPHPEVFLREEGDGAALLYDSRTGAVRLLNATAVSIWKLLDGKRTLNEVLEVLRRDYRGMDEETAGQVLSLAGELLRLGVAEAEEG